MLIIFVREPFFLILITLKLYWIYKCTIGVKTLLLLPWEFATKNWQFGLSWADPGVRADLAIGGGEAAAAADAAASKGGIMAQQRGKRLLPKERPKNRFGKGKI